MIVTSYDPDKIAYEQFRCGICLAEYQPNDPIVELACKHIFHQECLPDSIVRCPACQTVIATRVVTYGPNEVAQEVDDLIGHVRQLFAHLPAEILLRNRDLIVDLIYTSTTTTYRTTDLMALAKKLNLGLTSILSENTEIADGLVRDCTYAINEELKKQLTEPVTLEEQVIRLKSPETLVKLAKGLAATLQVNEKLTRFVGKVAENVFTANLVEMCKVRERKFVQLTLEHLKTKNFFGRVTHIRGLSQEQLAALKEAISPRDPALIAASCVKHLEHFAVAMAVSGVVLLLIL